MTPPRRTPAHQPPTSLTSLTRRPPDGADPGGDAPPAPTRT